MKEWYLMRSPIMFSGDEGEILDEYKDDAFNELLESGAAEDVELCNFDLSIRIGIKAIVQSKTSDTKLKTLTREVYFPIGMSKAGMYVYYRGIYWLITGFVDNNGIYEKAIVSNCNYLLTWLNKDGNVIQRWANITSASQYNNGETYSTYYYLRSDQLMVAIPNDNESMRIEQGHRFIIDERCRIYERDLEDIAIDTSNPVITYKLTRADSVLYNYIDSGHFQFIATQDDQHESDGYYKINGSGYWLCDIPETPINNGMSISYDSDVVYCGIRSNGKLAVS